jgi:hypothetical protein
VPAEYTDSPFPLQYYFVVSTPTVTLYPGLNDTWTNQPYFVIRQA